MNIACALLEALKSFMAFPVVSYCRGISTWLIVEKEKVGRHNMLYSHPASSKVWPKCLCWSMRRLLCDASSCVAGKVDIKEARSFKRLKSLLQNGKLTKIYWWGLWNYRIKDLTNFCAPGPEGSRIWVCRPLFRSHFKVSKGP